MKLTKHTHACVVVESESATILVDPGAFGSESADLLATADAVVITHEHFDHLDVEKIGDALTARPDLPLYGPPSIAGLIEGHADRITTVTAGDSFSVGDVDVTVHGERHAVIHPDIPVIDNVGYLFGGRIFHPGDSYEVPEADVEVLLVPISGPWMKIGEAADFIRAVAPRRSIAIHEMLLSDVGKSLADNFLGTDGLTEVSLEQPTPGTVIEI
ncbi:MBL fold metallo-hydrolase [Williamsia sp. Leaf354]|jgi:L-ascorbate metabolism protein UlaG (beta-lactamase superfamily)|uniref:MBL fold metallo-hydrolase n=1 Tax=Williamsia sp. Leaf354 TaxID=1736349 RepID=UPI0006FCDBED|nr:MBL fold metallo-hydrolase [Williamsia sp. Leaf354]KQR96496.1 MBL fold metallo-hydrolase [Williamsia sp. Leaf354]